MGAEQGVATLPDPLPTSSRGEQGLQPPAKGGKKQGQVGQPGAPPAFPRGWGSQCAPAPVPVAPHPFCPPCCSQGLHGCTRLEVGTDTSLASQLQPLHSCCAQTPREGGMGCLAAAPPSPRTPQHAHGDGESSSCSWAARDRCGGPGQPQAVSACPSKVPQLSHPAPAPGSLPAQGPHRFCTMFITIQSEGYTVLPIRSLKRMKVSMRKSCRREEMLGAGAQP